MKRTWTLLGIGLALALPLTACTRDKAPDVTPTPSPVCHLPAQHHAGEHPRSPQYHHARPEVPNTRRTAARPPVTRSGMPGMPPRT